MPTKVDIYAVCRCLLPGIRSSVPDDLLRFVSGPMPYSAWWQIIQDAAG
ncbi:MAG TPA: hypothetical protein VJ777_01865 [Mycobacterium sp.]|nr:hypothetical protein [Mycobacterium sp.]